MESYALITKIERGRFQSNEIAREKYWGQINSILKKKRELQQSLQADQPTLRLPRIMWYSTTKFGNGRELN